MRSITMFPVAAALWVATPASAEDQFRYVGLCEASGAVALDATHFAVASDETNAVQIYERGNPEPVGDADFQDLTDADKSDLEAAAVIGSTVYWISSHSFNKDGEDKKKRKRLFAAEIVPGSPPMLRGIVSISDLRDPLARAAGIAPSEMNIEGLAATPDGELLIGFRAPLSDQMATVIALQNPAQVLDGAPPDFGPPERVDLGGLGIRSLELVDGGASGYLALAGPASDRDQFELYRWNGPGADAPEPITTVDLTGLRPEAMIAFADGSTMILGDNGDTCSDETTPFVQRHFLSIVIELK